MPGGVRPSLSGLFSPYGRLRRRFFCYYMFAYVVLILALNFLGAFLSVLVPVMGQLVVLVLYVPALGAMLCQLMRRYHDFGVTGWVPGGFFCVTLLYGLLASWPGAPLQSALPVGWSEMLRVGLSALGLVVLFFVPALMPGQKGANRYGRNPRYAQDGQGGAA